LGVSKSELQEIYSVMKREFASTGHWYRCPNGHLYTIGECGGAVQVSNCPECGAQVGGSHHQLLENNNAATEIEAMMNRMTVRE
jgi:hypothetical protein